MKLNEKQTESLARNYTSEYMPLEDIILKAYKGKKDLPNRVEDEAFFKRFIGFVKSGEAELLRSSNAVLIIYKTPSTKDEAVFDMLSPTDSMKEAAIDFFTFMAALKNKGYKSAKTYTNGPTNKRFYESFLKGISKLEPADDPDAGEYMLITDLTKFGEE